ncbi:MAG: hypothetical protein LDL10_06315, partial [Calditerrivibrio sp.]|nr:hypothetical protein [Calditerrivibrio sp.]
ILIPISIFAVERPSVKHDIFLQGTDYELHVYRIYGKEAGTKGLIIGGIQGDEPGGYLSADMYVDSVIEKGDLIVVPRANFKSIILFNRGADGDMNRRFIDDKTQHEMDKVVEILKSLMGEVDFFLHLHDGSGFYDPKYVNKLRNPNRWGQSIIVDTDSITCNGKTIEMKSIALQVIKETNKKIKNDNYHFKYFNTDTDNPKTKYKDMKKTATYYALKNFCIPSYGLETSKNLPNDETKLRHKSYLIDEFLKIYGIKSKKLDIFLPKPILKSITLEIDNKTEEISNYSVLELNQNQKIKIEKISSNYYRGLSCDILEFNGLNDKDLYYIVRDDTTIRCKKDHITIGEIKIKVKKDEEVKKFLVSIDGKDEYLENGSSIRIKPGSNIVIGNFDNNSSIPVNLRGFLVEGATYNDGDDRNIKITISEKNLIKRFSKNNNGKEYEVIAGTLNNILGKFLLIIDNN